MQDAVVPAIGSILDPSGRRDHSAAIGKSERFLQAMRHSEPNLLKGFLMCLRDSDAVRLQTSRWKRSLLVFSSGICLEIAALPYLANWIGFESSWQTSLLTWLFMPLGLVGIYASKFGDDRFVEWLLVVPKLDLKI
jgi:hypothetical protein